MLCKFYKTVFGSGGFTRERLWFRAASGERDFSSGRRGRFVNFSEFVRA